MIHRNQPPMRVTSHDSNPPLRHRHKSKRPPSGGLFVFVLGGEKHAPCGACAGDSKGRAYRPGPLRIDQLLPLRGSPARLRRAFVVLIRFSTEQAFTAPYASVRVRMVELALISNALAYVRMAGLPLIS